MATLLSDAFTRADSTTTPGTPDVGGPYTVRAGTFGISSNRLYCPTPNGSGSGSHLTFPAASNVDISATLPVTLSGNALSLICRWQDASNMWMATVTNGGMFLRRVQAGSYVNYVVSSQIPEVGDVLRFLALGRDLYVFLNGRLKMWSIDQRYNNTYTVAGVQLLDNSQRIDDLLAVDATMPNIDGYLDDDPYAVADPEERLAFLYKGRNTKALDEGNEA